jgi:hypothetical protein
MISNVLPKYFAACSNGDFLGFPTWYKYLPSKTVNGTCTPVLDHLSYIWLIVAAVIEILLRVAAIVAVLFVIYGSISLITSQGKSDSTAKARDTIINALIGLAIAIMSAVSISFIAGHVQ